MEGAHEFFISQCCNDLYLPRNRIAQFDSNSRPSEDMNPEPLGITKPIIFALDLRKQDSLFDRVPEK
jgi:hypothetical protein